DGEEAGDGGDAGLAVPGRPGPLGQVEDEVGRVGEEPVEQLAAVAEFDRSVPHAAQRVGDGPDGGRAVKLFVQVVGGTGREGDLGLEVERDPDLHPWTPKAAGRGGGAAPPPARGTRPAPPARPRAGG